jgi:hypothetical protein
VADPKDVKSEIYATLKLTQKELNSAIFHLQLKDASQATKDKALAAITDTALAIQKFRKARLDAIAAEMKGANAGIEKAIKDLKDTLQDLQKIKPIIDAATAFLKIVGRIIALV